MNADPNTQPRPNGTELRPVQSQSLKHYQLESLLGEGGMGQVYRAWDSRLRRPVAVKLLSAELTPDPEHKQRLIQEAQAAARINHPSIAQIFDVDESEGATFIVMELVEGRTVRDLVQGRELDLLGAVDVGIQVAEGLAKAHERNIVHRDIKPANVMITPEGRVKILDFGLAKWLSPGRGLGAGGTQRLEVTTVATTLPGLIVGTPAYMSPEQARGQPVDCRADIFSLGVLLFEMVTGQSPFERPNSIDTFHAVAFEDTPPMNTFQPPIPEELQRIVTRCLGKRAEDRYPDVRRLADDLRAFRRRAQDGMGQPTPTYQRFADMWEQWRHVPRSRYAWYAAGLVLAGTALYFSLSIARMELPSLVFLWVVGLFIYRNIRNRPLRVQEMFVRRVAKIPEVRLIALYGHEATVVVDRPVAQLYGRINRQLRWCNRKLYFGKPITVSILHEVPPPQMHQLLMSRGVQYVREIPLQPEPKEGT